jgi:hypothetical protein
MTSEEENLRISTSPPGYKRQFSYIEEYSEPISPAELLSEQENQEEARKDSQLLLRLQELQKRQKMLQKISEQVRQVSASPTYFRKTNLDHPPARIDFSSDEESKDRGREDFAMNSKLSKEQLIEDQEIKAYFIAFNENDFKPQVLDMRYDNDIARLCKLYLENLNDLKVCLPSENVELRMHQCMVQEMPAQKNTISASENRMSSRVRESAESFNGLDRSSTVQRDAMMRSTRKDSALSAS